MGIYLGSSGCVELKRTQFDEAMTSSVNNSDVNANKNRFSFDFNIGSLITGDRIEIRRTDGDATDLLTFISPSGWPNNTRYRDGRWYIFVDEAGSVSLYETFDAALSGEASNRVDLVNPGETLDIEVTVVNSNYRILAQVKDYELNTSRDAVDVTGLSEEFRHMYSGLISGSGSLTCFFEYEARNCDPAICGPKDDYEMPIYMNQLLLRTEIGSEFHGKFTLVNRGVKPTGDQEDIDDVIWYEFDARVTNVAMAFNPSQPIESRIDFVATGPIQLRTKFVSNYLTQEDNDLIELEESQDGALEVEQQE